MSLPTSLRAYIDCQKVYDAATEDPKGARVCLGTYEACINMRSRMHYFRKLDRRANAETYTDPQHPMHNVSRYDDFVIQIQQDTAGEFWLYVQNRDAKILAIEGLSQVDDAPLDVDGAEVHLIEDQTNG
jgi:hypothetical protein